MSERQILTGINYFLYAIVILVPLVFWQHTMFPFIVPKTVIFQSLAEIIIALWLTLAFFKKEYRPRFTPGTISLFVFIGLLTVASAFGADFSASVWSIVTRMTGLFLLWHFAFLFLALVSLREQIRWGNIWLASLAASGVAALGALLCFEGSWVQTFLLNQDIYRPGSTFGNPAYLAGYLLFHVFIGGWIFFKADYQSSWLRWAAGAIALIDAAAIFRTQTRGDVLGMFVGFFIIVCFLASRRLRPFSVSWSLLRNGWFWVVLFIAVLAIAFFFTSNLPFWQRIPGASRFTNFSAAQDEFRLRLLTWRSAWQGIRDRPLLGWGWDNFNIPFQRHYAPQLLRFDFGETFWDKPHNVLIEYAVTGGLISLLAYLVLWAAFGFELFRLRDDTFKFVFAGMFVAYFVRNLAIFDTLGTYLLFFFALAFIDSEYTRASKSVVFHDREKHNRQTSSRSYPAAYLFLIPAALLIYFVNWPIARAMYLEYDGPNYYLLGALDKSRDAFEAALRVSNPYQDETRNNFASVVKEAQSFGTPFPDLKNLQAQLVHEIETVIAHHPQDYFNYTYLAEFKNQFYGFDPRYLDDADALAQKALILSPNRQQVYYVIAKTQLLRGEHDEAMKTFEKAIAVYPDAGDPHFYLALLAYEAGDKKRGDTEMTRARDLGRWPRSFGEAAALGTLVGDLEEDYHFAIVYYLAALQMKANDAAKLKVELQMALAYYYLHLPNEARYYFENVAKQTDLSKSPIYPSLKPIFIDLGLPL